MKWDKVKIKNNSFEYARGTGGVAHIKAPNLEAYYQAMGFLHAKDRLTQMMLVRLAGQGRLGECLKGSESTFVVDKFMRETGFYFEAKKEEKLLSEETHKLMQSYCDGVNAYLEKHRRPFEFLVVKYRPEPWCIADTLLTIKIMGYIGLAQSQQDTQKLIIQMIRKDACIERLKGLYEPHLQELDKEIIDLCKKLNLYRTSIPEEVKVSPLPTVMASNNWVLAPSRSSSDAVLQCNDPHLEVNRLPAIWYEFNASFEGDYQIGVNMPGVPGLVMGRTKTLSYGFTYGFMDMLDYFIEEVKDSKVRRGDDFVAIQTREEYVRVKGKDPVKLLIRETSHGILEVDSQQEKLEDGYYLARAYTGHREGAYQTLDVISGLHEIKTTGELCKELSKITISANWLVGDKNGDIAYQQSGRLPKRDFSGLLAQKGWEKEWQGIVDPGDLASAQNPSCGFLVTANSDENQPGKAVGINLCMAPYRKNRIRDMIQGKAKHDVKSMAKIQSDLFSIQGQVLLAPHLAHLPENEAGQILKKWDYRYDKHSVGAYVFQKVYEKWLERVFGDGFYGEEIWSKINQETATIMDFYAAFDRILVEPEFEYSPLWFQERSRTEILREILLAELEVLSKQKLHTWGEIRKVVMVNLFFDGLLPEWAGFDHGPVIIEGSRATVVQGSLYDRNGKKTAFCPSYRFIADLASDEAHTVLAGGPSDRRFSPLYKSDIEKWLNYEYKILKGI